MVIVAQLLDWRFSRCMALDRATEGAFLGISALLFAVSRSADSALVHVHVGDGRDADARRLDDVDGVDADARTDVACRRGVVPRQCGS